LAVRFGADRPQSPVTPLVRIGLIHRIAYQDALTILRDKGNRSEHTGV
jgi:hypothetical protein